jgi:site-specific DNA-methyltransferase (adenine-specific)
MSLASICKLPVARLAADDAALFLWATYPVIREALQVIEAWGFTYKSIAFQWLKIYPSGKPFFGLGRWTRGNTEPCLLATRGKPHRVANDVSQVVLTDELIVAPLGKHSAKPPETRDRIVKLMGDVPRLEMFARDRVPGWTPWGNQVPAAATTPDYDDVSNW